MILFTAKYSPLFEGAVPQVAGDRGEGGPHGRGGGARAVTRRIASIAMTRSFASDESHQNVNRGLCER